jgi:hypothetical protein
MKKIIAIAFLGTIGLVSCKKDYTCECVQTIGTNVYTIKETTKKVAKAVCEGKGYDGIENASGTPIVETNEGCTLK